MDLVASLAPVLGSIPPEVATLFSMIAIKAPDELLALGREIPEELLGEMDVITSLIPGLGCLPPEVATIISAIAITAPEKLLALGGEISEDLLVVASVLRRVSYTFRNDMPAVMVTPTGVVYAENKPHVALVRILSLAHDRSPIGHASCM